MTYIKALLHISAWTARYAISEIVSTNYVNALSLKHDCRCTNTIIIKDNYDWRFLICMNDNIRKGCLHNAHK